MKRILVCTNPSRDPDLSYTKRAVDILRADGFSLALSFPFDTDKDASSLGIPLEPLERGLDKADCMLCLGGDGTILHVARFAARRHIPLVTVNLGHLGFICELDAEEFEQIRTLKENRYTVENRMMLDVSVLRDGRCVCHRIALNEATFHRGAVSRVIGLRLSVNGSPLHELRGDGLIVATPTGSTGYSFSAGGPLMEPKAKAIIVTPICAHNTRTGSFVLLAEDEVAVDAVGKSRSNGFLCVDGGKPFALREGDRVLMRCAKDELSLLRLTNRSFYSECGRKMLYGGYHYER